MCQERRQTTVWSARVWWLLYLSAKIGCQSSEEGYSAWTCMTVNSSWTKQPSVKCDRDFSVSNSMTENHGNNIHISCSLLTNPTVFRCSSVRVPASRLCVACGYEKRSLRVFCMVDVSSASVRVLPVSAPVILASLHTPASNGLAGPICHASFRIWRT